MSKNLDDCKILDATCGSRTIWFTKDNPNCLYIDKRVEHGTRIWKSTKNDSERRIDVEPDIVADFTQLPFPDKSFYLVVFDPPHLVKIGENAWLKKKYGKLPENWKPLIRDGFKECMRVLKPNGISNDSFGEKSKSACNETATRKPQSLSTILDSKGRV